MDASDLEGRPHKKRRMWAGDSSPAVNSALSSSPPPIASSALSRGHVPTSPIHVQSDDDEAKQNEAQPDSFGDSLKAVGLELSPPDLEQLRRKSGSHVQRALNMYYDGSWKAVPIRTAPSPFPNPRPRPVDAWATKLGTKESDWVKSPEYTPERGSNTLSNPPIPEKRYVGSFQADGWATRSGTGLLKIGDKVGIERVKTQETAAMKRKGIQDVTVRFTNERGEAVGRLSQEHASWVSSLIDQGVCFFEGSCFYTPDRLRTSETVYLQLRCYFLSKAFEKRTFTKLDSNRTVNFFLEKESQDEKDLRLRQVALIKLFEAIDASPTRTSDTITNDKDKRRHLLQAAENAEIKEQKSEQKTKKPAEAGPSTPTDEAEEGEELEEDQLDSLYKKAQSFDFNTPQETPAETFAMSLRKYQKQALYWMMNKEKNALLKHKEKSMHPLWEEYEWPTEDADNMPVPAADGQSKYYVNPYSGELSLDFPEQEQNCLGGILADEMGLGKTIEMLSLIHTHRAPLPDPETAPSLDTLPRLHENSAAVERAPYTTLVVAPMSLLAQWASEAEKASKKGTLKVLVYYGADKSANLQKLCCEANSANAPNVIITSYGTILSEYNQVANMNGNRGSHGGIFSLDYFRIILDEAHTIKNRQSKTAKACYELASTHRWVLTGTPIVNRLEDLFSLVRFLKVEPWSNFSFWRTFITVPFESKDFIKALNVVQTVLEPLVLRRTKDMKTPEGEALVPLPPRTIAIDRVELSQDEQDVYDHIHLRAQNVLRANADAGTLLKSYTTIFTQILRLRQSCCHPVLTRKKDFVADEEDAVVSSDLAKGLADDMDLGALIERFTSDGEQDANRFGAHVLQQIQDEADSECPICSEEPMIEQAVTGCWHSACKACLLNYINHQRDKGITPLCFNCRTPINARDVFEVVRHDHVTDTDKIRSDSLENGTPSPSQAPRISLRRIGISGSAKTQALLTHLKQIRREDKTVKSVVFSYFTSFIDLLEPALTRDHIPFLRLDGSLSQKQRAAVLTEYATSPKPYVFLISIKAGGVGLNLTCASRVFIMDPWWNYATEAQAIDRVHRMGQEREVKVVRFIVKGSIEEKILKVQDKKNFIANSLMKSDEEKRVQRIEDMMDLLS